MVSNRSQCQEVQLWCICCFHLTCCSCYLPDLHIAIQVCQQITVVSLAVSAALCSVVRPLCTCPAAQLQLEQVMVLGSNRGNLGYSLTLGIPRPWVFPDLGYSPTAICPKVLLPRSQGCDFLQTLCRQLVPGLSYHERVQ